jgi:hypothetical protein
MILTGENRRTRRKTCTSATLSITNPTYTALGANKGLRDEKPATNYLRYDTTLSPYDTCPPLSGLVLLTVEVLEVG